MKITKILYFLIVPYSSQNFRVTISLARPSYYSGKNQWHVWSFLLEIFLLPCQCTGVFAGDSGFSGRLWRVWRVWCQLLSCCKSLFITHLYTFSIIVPASLWLCFFYHYIVQQPYNSNMNRSRIKGGRDSIIITSTYLWISGWSCLPSRTRACQRIKGLCIREHWAGQVVSHLLRERARHLLELLFLMNVSILT